MYNSIGVIIVRDIGKNIRDMRTMRKMTQEDLAAALYVTRQTVSNYETGKSKPDVDTLLRIAMIMETDANTLIYGPQIPEDRKQAKKWLIIFCAVLAVVGMLYIGLLFLYEKYAMELYYVPLHFGNLTLRPSFLFVLGWLLIHVAGMLCQWKLPTGKTVRIMRIILLVFLGIIVLAVTPFAVWLLVCLHKSITTSSVNMLFPAIPVYYSFLQVCVHVLLKYPFLCSLIGGLCWLLGVPNHQKASADH